MNGKDLLIGLGSISTEYYAEAETAVVSPAGKQKPVLFAALIAAVLLLAGCAYLALSESDWFKAFFSGQLQQPLSPGQSAYIEEKTREFARSVTVNGYTFTLESAIADSRNIYFKLRLQGPPGTPLDGDFYHYTPRRTPDGRDAERTFYRLDSNQAPDYGYYDAGTWQMIDGSETGDGSVGILYHLRQTGNTDQPPFEAGVPYRLHLTDLTALYEDGGTSRNVVVCEGVWDFDIVFESLNDDAVELVTQPVFTSFNDFQIEVTSFTLRTMSASAAYSGREDEKGIVCFVDSAVVLKDGTRVPIRPGQFSAGSASFVLASPIVLEEVDYVELRDGTRIPMPQHQE